ncbi:hypothetical protein D6792_02105 [Candidatus Parcubacteria bacterium]|nr:MAG: hypothetical protein D6792_02105 [Candidatus Parcubacteria bacterium]
MAALTEVVSWIQTVGTVVVEHFTARPYDALFVIVGLVVILVVVHLLSGVLKVAVYMLVVVVLALAAAWFLRELEWWQMGAVTLPFH